MLSHHQCTYLMYIHECTIPVPVREQSGSRTVQVLDKYLDLTGTCSGQAWRVLVRKNPSRRGPQPETPRLVYGDDRASAEGD